MSDINEGKSQVRPVKKIKTKKSKHTLRAQWGSSLFLIPSVAGVCLFFFMPYLVVIYYSFVDNPISKNFAGFSNYVSVFNNLAFKTAIKNTGVFSAIAVPLAVLFALLLALLLDNKIPFRTQFRTFLLSPMMVPVASIVLIWQVLFDYNGAINSVLGHFGADKIDWLKSDKAIIVIVVLFLWKNIGYNMILFLAALSSVPQDIIEVARLESAGSFKIFFMIKLRYMVSTLVFVTIMSLINSFKIFREIYLLTTDYPYESVYMLQHFMNNKFKSLDYQTLSAAAVMMSLVMVVIIVVLFKAEEHFSKDLDS
ncbi:MAG: sugar ABC transporter permease [Lachnospiraceae bacterium]|nr:sugar ABC transporter permease [Lachnospiraceae bacterium]